MSITTLALRRGVCGMTMASPPTAGDGLLGASYRVWVITNNKQQTHTTHRIDQRWIWCSGCCLREGGGSPPLQETFFGTISRPPAPELESIWRPHSKSCFFLFRCRVIFIKLFWVRGSGLGWSGKYSFSFNGCQPVDYSQTDTQPFPVFEQAFAACMQWTFASARSCLQIVILGRGLSTCAHGPWDCAWQRELSCSTSRAVA